LFEIATSIAQSVAHPRSSVLCPLGERSHRIIQIV
jgi:hypothetical protein